MGHSKSRCRSPDKSGLRNEHSDISELVESRSEDPDVSGDADESAPVRLKTAPTVRLVGAVSNCAVSTHHGTYQRAKVSIYL